jgi:hypothetical protein
MEFRPYLLEDSMGQPFDESQVSIRDNDRWGATVEFHQLAQRYHLILFPVLAGNFHQRVEPFFRYCGQAGDEVDSQYVVGLART